jgi:hypothetical protein
MQQDRYCFGSRWIKKNAKPFSVVSIAASSRIESKQVLFYIQKETFQCSRIVIGSDPSSEGSWYHGFMELQPAMLWNKFDFLLEDSSGTKVIQ